MRSVSRLVFGLAAVLVPLDAFGMTIIELPDTYVSADTPFGELAVYGSEGRGYTVIVVFDHSLSMPVRPAYVALITVAAVAFAVLGAWFLRRAAHAQGPDVPDHDN